MLKYRNCINLCNSNMLIVFCYIIVIMFIIFIVLKVNLGGYICL